MALLTPWLWAFALGCVALGTLLNESFNPAVLNRYSLPWVAVILASVLSFAVATALAARQSLAGSRALDAGDLSGARYRFLFGTAAAGWGASLLTQYRVDPFHVRRLFVGEFFGATQTAGVLLEYLAQVSLGLAMLHFLISRAFNAKARGAYRVAGGLVIVASIAATYLIAEGATRVANIVWLQPQGEPTKPTRMWHVRYEAPNSLGFRGGEFEQRTQPDEFRILVLGDSITYGTGVTNPADRFTSVLAEQLGRTGQFRHARVFNAGVKGTHSVDHLQTLGQLSWLQPDLVILAYYFNDIEHLVPLPLGDTPFGAPSFWSRFRLHRVLMLNSHLFDQLLLRYRRARRMNPEAARPDHFFASYANPDLLSRHLDVLEEIFAKAQSFGAAFRLVPFDIAVRHDDRYEARYQRFVEACLGRRISVWPMGRVFDGFSYWDLRVSRWDGHPNEQAHHVVGRFLAERILAEATMFRRAGEARPAW
ncbi:MAG: SGNH/GDSL hydrolase family protein [Candidatus Rokubacteria bacterium]|nr:SGNH/GDSL hydrolase family protein [Candidatus Rokubacteria bacterium]